jgi:hypothetical protein
MQLARVVSLVVLTLTSWVGVAGADTSGAIPTMVWRFDPSARLERSRVRRFGVGPQVDATTRLEPELQASTDVERLPELERLMDALVGDAAKTEALLGAGTRVVKLNKPPRKVADQYLDSPDGVFAATESSLRLRDENGVVQLNFKPRGAQRFASGMVYRIEGGATLPTGSIPGDGTIEPRVEAFLRNRRLRDNILRELAVLYPGRDLRELVNLALQIRQFRRMYEIQRLEGGAYVKAAEISLDDVTAFHPTDGARTARFGRVELEGNHVTLQLTPEQAQALAGTTWSGPHAFADVVNPALTSSPDVRETNRLAEQMRDYLGVTASPHGKYVEARQRLGIATTAKPPPIRLTRALARRIGPAGRALVAQTRVPAPRSRSRR